MSRHETEMHRQRRIALDALREIARFCAKEKHPEPAAIGLFALAAIREIEQCGTGIFGDHSQMDLADRRDLER